MAEKNDKTDNLELSKEGIEKNDSEDDADIKDSEEKEPSGEDKESRGKRFFGLRIWIMLPVTFLILAIIGTGSRWIPNFLPDKKEIGSYSAFADIKDDNLTEENLSPFFIPPSSHLSRGAVRIDLSAVWDGLASVRYRKNELQTRSRLYDYITGVAEKNEDLNLVISDMEEGMNRILQESLGVRGLTVRIKEIKYL
jgi:hypothetical protein